MNDPMPVVLTPEQLKAAASLRLERAMALIEEAQNKLASACAELSTLEGGIPVWNACHKLTDHVHTFWYRVQKLRQSGKYRLDRMSVESLQQRIAADRLRAAKISTDAKEPLI